MDHCRRAVRFVFAVMVGFVSVIATAEEITLPHQGVSLNADLRLARGKTLADGVILLTHGTLAHRDMEVITYLRTLLDDKGYTTLAINLGLGVNNRHGMYECGVTHRHRDTDAVGEIGAWVDWLKSKGAKHVTLLGHSRGGAQTALYAAEHDNPMIEAVVLLAPAIHDNASHERYQQRFKKPLAPLLAQAQQLVKDGKGDTPLQHVDFLYCADTSVTAAAFLSYYAPEPRHDTLASLQKIRKPTLLVVAGGDEVVLDLATKAAPFVDGKRVQMTVIDGADHFFRDLNSDEAVEKIYGFLRGRKE